MASRGTDGWRDEETAHIMDDLSEADRSAVEAVMAEGWAMLRAARLVGLMRALEDRADARVAELEGRVEALEEEIRSLRGG
jgi:polyhydroxyalkanoate synthesis regulator phasin